MSSAKCTYTIFARVNVFVKCSVSMRVWKEYSMFICGWKINEEWWTSFTRSISVDEWSVNTQHEEDRTACVHLLCREEYFCGCGRTPLSRFFTTILIIQTSKKARYVRTVFRSCFMRNSWHIGVIFKKNRLGSSVHHLQLQDRERYSPTLIGYCPPCLLNIPISTPENAPKITYFSRFKTACAEVVTSFGNIL